MRGIISEVVPNHMAFLISPALYIVAFFTIDSSIHVAILGVLTIIVQQSFSMWIAARTRRWDKEDRAAKAKEMKAALAEHHRAGAVAADNRTEKVLNAVQENTDISVKAFIEANGINNKIADLGLQIVKQKTVVVDANDKVKTSEQLRSE